MLNEKQLQAYLAAVVVHVCGISPEDVDHNLDGEHGFCQASVELNPELAEALHKKKVTIRDIARRDGGHTIFVTVCNPDAEVPVLHLGGNKVRLEVDRGRA